MNFFLFEPTTDARTLIDDSDFKVVWSDEEDETDKPTNGSIGSPATKSKLPLNHGTVNGSSFLLVFLICSRCF